MGLLLKISDYFQNSKYTNEHLNGNNLSYQKFIVLTYKRSGGNYFLDLLRSHPQIVSFAGLYGNNSPAFVYPGYPAINCKKTMRYRNRYPVEFLKKRVFRNYNQSVKAVGFKIVYETKYPVVLEYLKTLPDLKILNLQRRNILKMYLSDMIAITTNTWHTLSKEHEQFVKDIGAESLVRYIENKDEFISPESIKIELKYENCLKEFIKIKNYTEVFKNYFKPGQTHIIYYEDLLKNFSEEIKKVQDFLGVDNYELTSRFIKINNKRMSDVITNYHELKEKFKGSEWETFFEE